MKATPENVENLAQQVEEQNSKFRLFLKTQDRLSDAELDELVFSITRRVWEDIDCTTCARCCKELQPGMTDAEQQRLAERLCLTVEEFRSRYLERATDEDDGGEPSDEPTWRIATKPCPFLNENKCSVYEDRPAECRGYPYFYEKDFSWRTMGMLERTFVCPIVYEVFEELKKEIWHRR